MRTTMLPSGGITKRLDRLVEAGLVECRPDTADRRGTLVRLTRQGKAAIDSAIETHVLKSACSRRSARPAHSRRSAARLLAGLEAKK
jgi:DNA-binding MarR family transcriptional regulator